MNYDGLERSYWESQIERVERLRQKIAARDAVQTGRVVPADTDLVIGDGAVEKNTGDGLMAYFEEPSSATLGDTSAKRAVACALTMDATNELLIAPILRATGVLPLQFRTVMDYGSVTIARIGAPQRFNANVAIGNIANFASRMLALIGPNEIALGSSARSRLPSYWQTAWTTLSPVKTGWTYLNSQLPYPLYVYTGRWARLV